MSTLWRVSDPDRLVFHDWESDVSLFDRLTGQTHLLSALPAETLYRVAAASTTEETVAASIAEGHGMENDGPWRNLVHQSLLQLAALDLIEQQHASG